MVLQLDHKTPVLHDIDPRAREAFCRFVIPDAELEPDGLRPFRKNVVDVRGDVFGTSEDVHHVDFTWGVCDAPNDRDAEYLDDLGVVDGHRHDLEPDALRVFGDVVCRLSRLRLDTQDRDSARALENARDAGVVVHEMRTPVRRGGGHEREMCEDRAQSATALGGPLTFVRLKPLADMENHLG